MEINGCLVNVGDILTDKVGQFKIMAIKDGYAMVRRKGCVPFVVSIKYLKNEGIIQEFKL